MKKINHALYLLLVIVLAGLLGGIGNYYLLHDPAIMANMSGMAFQNGFLERSLVLGLIASALMPLFLNVISSNLLDSDGNGMKTKHIFIFAGLCLVASLFSNRFLIKVYEGAIGEEVAAVKMEVENAKRTAEDAGRHAAAALSVDIIRSNKGDEEKGDVDAKDILVEAKEHELNPDQIVTLSFVRTMDRDSTELKKRLDAIGINYYSNISSLKDKGLITEGDMQTDQRQ